MVKHTLKSCGVLISRPLKYVWPFFNIMHKTVNNYRQKDIVAPFFINRNLQSETAFPIKHFSITMFFYSSVNGLIFILPTKVILKANENIRTSYFFFIYARHKTT